MLHAVGGYRGRSNWCDDRNEPMPGLYAAMPPEMIAPWISNRAELRVTDVVAKDFDEFKACSACSDCGRSSGLFTLAFESRSLWQSTPPPRAASSTLSTRTRRLSSCTAARSATSASTFSTTWPATRATAKRRAGTDLFLHGRIPAPLAPLRLTAAAAHEDQESLCLARCATAKHSQPTCTASWWGGTT